MQNESQRLFITKVDIRRLGQNDIVHFSTQHSNYQFKILMPNTKRGILSGGSLGSIGQNATLLMSYNNEIDYINTLSINSFAIFFIEENEKEARRIKTTIIKSVCLEKAQINSH